MPTSALPNQADLPSPDTPVTLLISALEDASTQDDRLPWFQTWGTGISISTMLAGWLALLAYDYWKKSILVWFALAALVLGVAGAVICGFFGVRTIWSDLRRFDREFLASMSTKVSERYRLAQRIGDGFDAKQIRFAKDYLQSVCVNIRGRLGLIIGALEKVGVVPLAASAVVAFVKTYTAGPFAAAWYFGVGFLAFIYLLSMKLLGFAHTVERFVVVLNHAVMYAIERAVSIARPDLKG